MIWDVIGMIAGAFFYAVVVFNVVSILISVITRYKMIRVKNLIISLSISLLITFFLAEALYSWPKVAAGHIPMLLLVFYYDYHKARYQKCPECAERIKADAFKCKYCHSVIRQSA
jgi:Ca2+/Na+ antiporter